jgi:hypothetical protein
MRLGITVPAKKQSSRLGKRMSPAESPTDLKKTGVGTRNSCMWGGRRGIPQPVFEMDWAK